MAELEAAAIGPDVPPGPCSVAIHSVFRSALNLQPEGGGNLITVLGREASDHPQSVRLATTEDFQALGLEPHRPGWFHEGGLTLDRSGSPLHISFARAERLLPEPLPIIGHLGDPWQEGVALLAILQDEAGTDLRIRALVAGEPAQGALGERLTRAALDLGDAVRAGADTQGACARLIGLGSGLTPTGDDFLCGLLAAAHCRRAALDGLKAAVLGRLGHTNAISGTFLACAAEGRVCRAFHELASALREGVHSRSAVVRMCALGHSSGMDITTGFLFGLTLWT